MADEQKTETQETTPAAPKEGQAASTAPPFDKDVFIAEYTKREKALRDTHAAEIKKHQADIKRLQAQASLKDLPEEQREVLSDRGVFNADSASYVKDKFGLPDELEPDILSKGSYSEMVKYGERMAKILGTATKSEAKSIAEELAGKLANVTEIDKSAASEKVMQGSGSGVKTLNRITPATKDTIDKLWLDAEMAGGPNPYDEQYRKFRQTGNL